ncbi:hypothetical protein FKW77_004319 [Venturia effusa]|uniref:Uncharacterized protein n=1 Tax=Venturia effusa TaxID=50376 RepID=A0A517LMW2_9PEZI|nr:hypothetical protein FKW77_004319 [Venturia effusa]
MSDSDNDFIDDDELPNKGAQRTKAKKRTRAAWEASIHERENPLLGQETGVGLIEELAWKAEAKKRERLVHHFLLRIDIAKVPADMDPGWLHRNWIKGVGGDDGESWDFVAAPAFQEEAGALRRFKYHATQSNTALSKPISILSCRTARRKRDSVAHSAALRV